METYFKSEFTLSEKYLEKLHKNTVSAWHKVLYITFSVVYIVIGLFFLTAYFYADVKPSTLVSSLALFFCGIWLSCSLFYRKKSYGKRVIKNCKRCIGDDLTRSLEFSDVISSSAPSLGKDTADYNYSDVIRISETKDIYLLKLGKNFHIHCPKNSFIIADEAKFMDFLREKCPSSKIRGK